MSESTTIDRAIEENMFDSTDVIEEKANGEEVKPPRKKATPRAKAKVTKKKATKKKATKAKATKVKTNGKAKPVKATKAKAKADAKRPHMKPSTKAVQATKAESKGSSTISQMDMRHQLIIYTMNRMDREVTYGELGNETGFSRAVLRRVVNSQTGNDSLIHKGLVAVNQYETQDDEFSSPYFFRLTDAGKKMVN